MIDQLPKGKHNLVVLDTETSGMHRDDGARVSTVSLAGDGWSIAIPFDQGFTDKVIPRGYQPGLFDIEAPNQSQSVWEDLVCWLSNQWLIMHNAKFDLHMMEVGTRQWAGMDLAPRVIHDTGVSSYIRWPLELKALKSIAGRLWGEGEREAERDMKSWFGKKKASERRYDLAPWNIMEPYARVDAELTWRLFEVMEEMLYTGEIDPMTYRREHDFMISLFRCEQRGVAFDTESAWDAATRLDQEAKRIQREIPFSPPTEDQARKFFFDNADRAPFETTPGGKAKVSNDVIERLVELGVPGAAPYANYSHITDAVSMWYRGWGSKVGPDERLRPVFHQTKTDEGRGTITGRLAVERVQLQAIPHDYRLDWLPAGVPTVRSLFYSRPSHHCYELDLSQAEMRIAASVSNCKSLIERFIAGDDAHSATARLVFGTNEDHHDWTRHRQLSKRLNFGIIYGAGTDTLVATIESEGIRTTAAEVIVWRKMYREAMPEIIRTARAADELAASQRWIPLISGRCRYFRPDEFTHKAFNALIQGNVAEMMKDVMNMIERRWPGVMLLQIHDSVIVEVHDDVAKDVIPAMEAEIAKVFYDAFKVPFKTDSKIWASPLVESQ